MLSRSSFGNISGRYFRIDTPWNGDTEGELVRYPDEPKKQGPPRRPGRRWSCRIENLSPGAPLLNIAPQLDLCVVAALPQPPRKCTVVAAVAAEQCAAYVCARAGGSHSSTVAWLHCTLCAPRRRWRIDFLIAVHRARAQARNMWCVCA